MSEQVQVASWVPLGHVWGVVEAGPVDVPEPWGPLARRRAHEAES